MTDRNSPIFLEKNQKVSLPVQQNFPILFHLFSDVNVGQNILEM